MELTFGSLFAGVGGFDLGFQNAGWENSWQVEWDSKCQSVLNKHWPDSDKYFNVEDVDGSKIKPVSLITFGSPCQDLSVAGKRAGLDGDRSSMFYEATRIIKEMRNATGNEYPKIAIWENVPGALTSNKGEDFSAVIDEMANIGALAIEWHILDAQWFGVPHRRRRLFLIASFCPTIVGRCGTQILPVPQDSDGNLKKSRKKRKQASTHALSGSDKVSGPTYGFNHKNGIDPQVSEEVFPTMRVESGGNSVAQPILYGKTGFGNYQEGGSTFRATSHKRPDENFVMHTVESFVKVIRSGARDADGNLPPEVWRQEDVSPTLNAFDNNSESRSTVLIVDGTRVNDVRVYDDGIVPTLMSRMGTGGNQVPLIAEPATAIPIQGTIIGRSDSAGPAGKGFGEPNDPSYTLDTVSMHAVCTPELILRRLTPIECERLMGFPDDHTRFADNGKEISNTNRYKMIGNAVAVPVVEWIANELKKYCY
jgi:DNA (cytosine-5)-methyltransferase 1